MKEILILSFSILFFSLNCSNDDISEWEKKEKIKTYLNILERERIQEEKACPPTDSPFLPCGKPE